jgi:hypothetical protein
MRNFIAFIALITLSLACTKDPPTTTTELENSDPAPVIAVSEEGLVDPAALNTVGIGDVESQMLLVVSLSKTSFADNISHTEDINKRKENVRATADVSAPYPEKLDVQILNFNNDNYPNDTYRGTVSLYVGKEIVHTFTYIAGEKASQDLESVTVDVMPYLEATAGSSTEIHARCKIEFYKNTKESEVTLDSPAPTDIAPVIKMSNPLRVTFK